MLIIVGNYCLTSPLQSANLLFIESNKKGQTMKRTNRVNAFKPYQTELMEHAKRVTDELCKSINKTVPAEVEGMPYARQYVLEEAIKLLQDRV
jgi:predicted DNA binding CopG/RHH family protein